MKANLNMMSRVVESTMTSRLRDFVRMNPPIFLASKVNTDLQEFLDEVYKFLSATGVTYREKPELASFQLRNVSQISYTQWKDNRPEELCPIVWEEFKEDFLGKYFLNEKKEVKVVAFINLKQGNISVE